MSPDPVTSSIQAIGQALYVKEPGDPRAIEATDIAQGEIGNCYFLASLGEIALFYPSYIAQHLITKTSPDTETVTLYDDANGGAVRLRTTEFAPVSETVDNTFSRNSVNSDNSADIVNGVKEIWPQVVEKAYGQDIGGYSKSGGYDVVALEALTGHKAFYQPIASLGLQELRHLSDAHALLTFDTPNTPHLPYKLIDDHAYMFAGLEQHGGHTFVDLLNPWGVDEPKPVPFAQLKQVFDGFNHGTI